MVLYDFFDHQYFSRKYIGGSTYKYKDNLLHNFYGAYWSCTGNSLTGVRLNWLRDDLKKATVKKNMRKILSDNGHTKAAIDGIFKVCESVLKSQLR